MPKIKKGYIQTENKILEIRFTLENIRTIRGTMKI